MLPVALLLASAPAGLLAGASNSTRFLVIGDWGGQSDAQPTTKGEVEDGAGMAAAAKAMGGVGFVVAVGDNFYDSGIQGDVTSPRFKETFEDVFAQPELQVPWYAMAGNHDHKGNVTAQIAYSAVSARWRFPHLWYTFERTDELPGGPLTTQIVAIDTTVLAGMSYHDEATGAFVEGEPHPAQAMAAGQLAWLNRTLAASTADYLWVAAHYPMYSQCSHGPGLRLLLQLLPMLRAARATGYLAGHDHCMGHYARHGMAFVLSGAGRSVVYGAKNLRNPLNGGPPQFRMDCNSNTTGPCEDESGFASVEATAAGATVSYHDQTGRVRYVSEPIAPRRRARA